MCTAKQKQENHRFFAKISRGSTLVSLRSSAKHSEKEPSKKCLSICQLAFIRQLQTQWDAFINQTVQNSGVMYFCIHHYIFRKDFCHCSPCSTMHSAHLYKKDVSKRNNGHAKSIVDQHHISVQILVYMFSEHDVEYIIEVTFFYIPCWPF